MVRSLVNSVLVIGLCYSLAPIATSEPTSLLQDNSHERMTHLDSQYNSMNRYLILIPSLCLLTICHSMAQVNQILLLVVVGVNGRGDSSLQ